MNVLERLLSGALDRHIDRRQQLELDLLRSILRELRSLRRLVETQGELTMKSLDDIIAEVQKERTQIEGVKTFVSGLSSKLEDALSGVKLNDTQQSKIDEIFAAVTENEDALAKAIATQPTGQPAPVGDTGATAGTGSDQPSGDVDAATGRPTGGGNPSGGQP